MAKTRAAKQPREVLDPDNELDVEIEDGETEIVSQDEVEPRIDTDEHGSEMSQEQELPVANTLTNEATAGVGTNTASAAAFKELMTEITPPTRLSLDNSDCDQIGLPITVPVAIADRSGFLPRHLNVKLKGQQARMLKRIYEALHAGSHRRSNGQHVDKLHHAIEWLIDQVIIKEEEVRSLTSLTINATEDVASS